MAGQEMRPGDRIVGLVHGMYAGELPNVGRVEDAAHGRIAVARLAGHVTVGRSGEVLVAVYTAEGQMAVDIHVVGDGCFDDELPYAECGSFTFAEQGIFCLPCGEAVKDQVPAQSPHVAAAVAVLDEIHAGKAQPLDGMQLHGLASELLHYGDHNMSTPLSSIPLSVALRQLGNEGIASW